MTVLIVGTAACRGSLPTQRSEPYLSAIPPGLSVLMPVPPDNPLTAEKVELGRRLFFDTRLSRDGTVACASCHVPDRAFTDGRSVAVGIGRARGRRNAPALYNRAYASTLFWDGRAASLEEQALQPMVGATELGNTHEEVVRRLRESHLYRELFTRAFGARAFGTEAISIERVAKAIASFERTLLSGDSAFDRYDVGGDEQALSPAARRGLELFRGKARCTFCHRTPLFTDNRFHNTGVSWRHRPPLSPAAVDGLDLGRYEVTGRQEDKGKFKTPSLRDVDQTAPYMHDGSLETLEEVIDFYDRGGEPNPYLDESITMLNLTAREKAQLIALLKSLTGN